MSAIVNRQTTNSRQRHDQEARKRRILIVFNTKAFLVEQFTNAQNVLVLFRAYGVTCPSLSAVEKWFTRQSVPGEYWPVMLCILEIERGEPIRLAHYFENRRHG